MGMPWDVTVESEVHELVVVICGTGPAATRDAAWHALLTRISPAIERWAASNPALRRVGLTGEDEARTILVGVIDRIERGDFANLRSYLARQEPDLTERADTDLVERLAKLADDGRREEPAAEGDLMIGTPLRGWLVTLTRFVSKEHILQRLGWRAVARWVAVVDRAPVPSLLGELRELAGVISVEYDAAACRLAIEHRPAQLRAAELERVIARHGIAISVARQPTKRDVASGADRLEVVPEVGERPPLSTLIGVRRALAEIRAHMEGFPLAMRQALDLWLDDTDFGEIATTLELASVADARALVRAGTARLRERFRGAWPELFG